MKHRLSVTVDEDTALQVQELLRSKRFRNKSHIVEYALSQLQTDEVSNK